jgi:hypothetical protein
VHRWFSKLFNDVCDTLGLTPEQRYWNQSVSQLSGMIVKVGDGVLRESFEQRLENYKQLSSTRPPDKSDLFQKVREILLKTGYLLGGTLAD